MKDFGGIKKGTPPRSNKSDAEMKTDRGHRRISRTTKGKHE